LWLEHPEHGRQVDVAVLPLANYAHVKLYPHSLTAGNARQVSLGVTSGVSIVGFPFGVSVADVTAIWTQGTIASEPHLNFDGLPCYLIDSRTREGQSGSPVLFFSRGGSYPKVDGSVAITPGVVSMFLGVYSGRINENSDLGKVWKPYVVSEIIDGSKRGRD